MLALNGRFLTQQITGVQRFGREVLREWMEMAQSAPDILIPVASRAVDELPKGASTRAVGRLNGHAWEQFELPAAAAERPLINLCNTAPAWRHKQLVVLHDAMVAAFPGNFQFMFRTWYRAMIRGFLTQSAHIATVSKFSAAEISKYFSIPLSRIQVIPESGEHILRTPADSAILTRLGLQRDRYFLAVSSASVNKNFAAVLRAVALTRCKDFRFVIVGGGNARVFNQAFDAIDTPAAVRTGYVNDAELRALYESAACFIYPSLYEGFGLPPLEAMSCGCPVIVSNAASLPEVCGKAALYCDPLDDRDISKVLEKVLSNADLRNELRAAGLAHAKNWRWRDAAAAIDAMAKELH